MVVAAFPSRQVLVVLETRERPQPVLVGLQQPQRVERAHARHQHVPTPEAAGAEAGRPWERSIALAPRPLVMAQRSPVRARTNVALSVPKRRPGRGCLPALPALSPRGRLDEQLTAVGGAGCHSIGLVLACTPRSESHPWRLAALAHAQDQLRERTALCQTHSGRTCQSHTPLASTSRTAGRRGARSLKSVRANAKR